MKTTAVIISILFCYIPSLMAYSPPVEPDTSYLPFLLDSTEYYSWNADSNEFTLNENRIYFYDENSILTGYEIYSSKGWRSRILTNSAVFEYVGNHEDRARTIGTYNTNNNALENIQYNWNSTINNWVRESHNFYAYDGYGNITERIHLGWDSIKTEWEKNDRVLYTYDEYGNPTEYVWYRWNSDLTDWAENTRERYVYTYDANGNQMEKISSRWDDFQNDWVDNTRYNFAYDENGNQTEYIHYGWDSNLSDWVEKNRQRYVYTYDAKGNQTENKDYYWNYNQNDWVEDGRYLYTYDENGNQTEVTGYEWSSKMNDWKESTKEHNIYDKNGKFTEQSAYFWNEEQNEWQIREKALAFWSDITLNSTSFRNKFTYALFPNPVTDFLTIKIHQPKHCYLEIYSLKGQLMYSTQIKLSLLQIDMSDFEKGIYFISIRREQDVYTEKIIKQ